MFKTIKKLSMNNNGHTHTPHNLSLCTLKLRENLNNVEIIHAVNSPG